jgi:thymidylate kinase
MVKQEPQRWVVVDAGRPWDIVHADLRSRIAAALPVK